VKVIRGNYYVVFGSKALTLTERTGAPYLWAKLVGKIQVLITFSRSLLLGVYFIITLKPNLFMALTR
jgi:hypothetical protein